MLSLRSLRLSRLDAARRSPTIVTGAWSFADQGLVSLASFLLMVLLARVLPASDFGAFVLVYMAIFFANNVQTSLVSRPHNLIGANLKNEAFRAYTARVFSLQLFITAVFGLIGAGAAYGARFFGSGSAELFAATALAMITWQLQEFARQVQFSRARARAVFSYDVISYGGQMVLLAALWYFEELTAVTAMLALAASSMASAVYGFSHIGIAPRGFPFPILRMHWRMGRWILGDNLGQWLSTMLFPFLAAAFAGTAATAVYRLVMNVVAPLHVVFNAVPSFAAPRASRVYHEGGMAALRSFVVLMSLLVGLPVCAYLLGVSIFGAQVLDLLYGQGYSQHANLIWLFAAAYLGQFVIGSESIALMAAGNARAIFLGRLVSIVLTLTVGVALTAAFGVEGAVGGLVVVNTGLCAVLAFILNGGKVSRRQQVREHLSLSAMRGRL